MQYTRIRKRRAGEVRDPLVYASLDALMRLRFVSSGFSFLPRQPVHSVLSGRHASRLRGRGLNFEELRNYLPGDDTRNIDWRVTARTREPHVRVYTEEKDRITWLLVDQRQSMFFGSRWKMKSVIAAEAAAIACWRVLAQGDRIGAIVVSEEDLDVIPPHRSQERVTRILECIVRRNQQLRAGAGEPSGAAMLNRALQRLAAETRHDCLVTLITDGAGINPESRKHITQMTAHNDVLAVLVYDPLEQAIPDAGRLVFGDGQRQVEFNSSERRLRDAYAADFQARLERMRDTSRRYAIPLLPVHTAEPVQGQLRAALGHRPAGP